VKILFNFNELEMLNFEELEFGDKITELTSDGEIWDNFEIIF
jgi:hypothetical protein